MMKKTTNKRRSFIQYGLASGAVVLAGATAFFQKIKKTNASTDKVKLLTTEGNVVEVDKTEVNEPCSHPVSRSEARIGIKGKKFVMVVDLSRCKNARKCISSCEKAHHIPHDRPFIKVLRMQDNEESSPYWMPKKCFQCDNPPCVKVCPVGATYKRTDGIVLIDNERCIGCRFCMAACPYSARVFNWGTPPDQNNPLAYSPETSTPSKIGTVGKCDFCPDMLRKNKLPHCVTSCPNGVIYFGDELDDTVTNGEETVRLSTLLKDKAGYRYMEELGTKPRVYYLPPVDRLFPFEKNDLEISDS